MPQELIVVTAATGNIGSKIVHRLLDHGKQVRAVGRSLEKLQPLIDKGAEAFIGSVENSQYMEKAFANAHAVFTLIPPKINALNVLEYQNKVSRNYARAIILNGVNYCVNLSSVAAHLKNKTGPIAGLYSHEQNLNAIEPLNLMHLRPGFFMENCFQNINLIKQMGINGTPLRSELPMPMIATRDIALVGSELLMSLNFKGKNVQELLGQRDISMEEATLILGKALSKNDLKYVQFSYADAQKAMITTGLSEDFSRLLVEMYQSFNDGLAQATEPRSSKNSTQTSFEDFAQEFAKIYNN